MVKVTFSLDDETVERIRRAAARLRKPQSQIVRDAVADYATKADRLSDRERNHLLGILEDLDSARPTRGTRSVDAEIHELRKTRRQGGRRSG
jgi:metal-responsive CopG/Arc/MetJ family transcriptional regulator